MKKLIFLFMWLVFLLCSTTASAEIIYTNGITSGPFFVAPNAASVDWVVTNNDSEPVDVRISIYHLIGGPKVLCCASPIVITLAPGLYDP